MNELGMLVLKRRGSGITLEQIQAIQEDIDREDMERALNPLGT
jgi:hypothetical protein